MLLPNLQLSASLFQHNFLNVPFLNADGRVLSKAIVKDCIDALKVDNHTSFIVKYAINLISSM